MDNGTGRAGGLKTAVYARLEETSFRSGAAAGAAALGVAGVVIAVTVTLGGHPVVQARAAGAMPSSAVPLAPSPVPTSVPASLAPSVSASPRHAAAASRIAPAPDYVPAARVAPAALPARRVRPQAFPPQPSVMRPGFPRFWGPPPGRWPWRPQRLPRPGW